MNKIIFIIGLIFITFCGQNLFSQENIKLKSKKIKNKKICITIDNLPAEKIYNKVQRQFINDRFLKAFKKYKVPAAGFVVGDNIEGDWELIVRWLEDSNTIGFLTYSGQDIENVPEEYFVTDIKRGMDTIEDILQTYKQKERFFRYPFLHYGTDPVMKKKIKDILKSQKIRIAYVTINTEDFVYNLSLEKNFNSLDSSGMEQIKKEYLDHIIERLASAETLAAEVAGRPVRHIMELRANRLNAFFIDDILTALEDRGYNFVTLSHALNDKIYRADDDYFGMKSLTFLERMKISK